MIEDEFEVVMQEAGNVSVWPLLQCRGIQKVRLPPLTKPKNLKMSTTGSSYSSGTVDCYNGRRLH